MVIAGTMIGAALGWWNAKALEGALHTMVEGRSARGATWLGVLLLLKFAVIGGAFWALWNLHRLNVFAAGFGGFLLVTLIVPFMKAWRASRER